MRINNLKFLFALLAAIVFISGCKKDRVTSKATFWPDIQINGEEFIILPVGSAYTDASATVTVGGAAVPFETDNTVDPNEVGYYTVTYSAVNEDGISASATREIIVVDTLAAPMDLSGTYQRATNTPVSVWVKDADNPYKYMANNPGGVNNNPPFDVPFTIYHVSPGIVVVPLQSAGALAPFYATTSAGGSTLIPFNTAANPGDLAYAWFLNGVNFSAVVRSFNKV